MVSSTLLLLGGCFLVGVAHGISDAELKVKIPNLGSVQGTRLTTVVSKREVAAFTGIPYGTIPARFSPAVLRTNLGVSEGAFFDATRPQEACMQIPLPGLEDGNFTEDCLSLNIYSPLTKTPLPVIFFIHGGSFIRWSGNLFDGRRLLDRDVVIVTINYRLNVFGFLCLESDEAPGNLGLYDQVLALNWVQKYISAFGGDPNRVTIAGQSAGGASVTYLLTSPLAQGLFHGAITSSGDDLSGWTTVPTPLPNSLLAAEAVGCANASSPTQNYTQILACMRLSSPAALLASTQYFYSAPVIQSFPLTIDKVTPTSPYSTLSTGGNLNRVPLMIGSNKNDGSFLVSRTYTSLAPTGLLQSPTFLKQSFVKSLLTSSSFGIVDTPIGIIDSLTNEYLGSAKNSGNFTAMAPGLIDIFSVFYFKAACFLTAKSVSAVSPVFLYSFDYFGSQTLYPFTGGIPQVPRGVAHVDDLMYLFYFGEFTKTEEKFISKLMVDHWVNFATTGNPNQRYINIPPLLTLWPPFTVEDPRFLKINVIPTVGSDYVGYWPDASRNIRS